MTRFTAIVSALLVGVTLAACGGEESTSSAPPARAVPLVYTTFYPTTYFAERLAGGDAEVVCPLPTDADPIFWVPSEEAILGYQRADLIVINGAQFEKWVSTTSLPLSRVIDTAKPFREQWIEFEGAVEHSHGPAGRHAHEGIDGHTWLDPVLARIQVAEIAKAMAGRLPQAAAAVEARLAALNADLDALDARLKAQSEGYDGHAVYASHPAYNYIAKRYGWKIVSLDLDPETMPSDEAFAGIRAGLEDVPARHLLWESAPLSEIADRCRAELGLESVVFSPCETHSEELRASGLDYLEMMDINLKALEPVLRPWDR